MVFSLARILSTTHAECAGLDGANGERVARKIQSCHPGKERDLCFAH
jgi:hypothetical protein